MTDWPRRIGSSLLGALFGAAFLMPPLIELVEFRRQGIALRVDGLSCFLVLVAPAVLMLVVSGRPEAWINVPLAVIGGVAIWQIVGQLNLNVDPWLQLGFVGLVLVSTLVLVVIRGMTDLAGAIFLKRLPTAWRWVNYSVFALSAVGMAWLGFHFGPRYSPDERSAIVRIHALLQGVLTQPASVLPEPLATIPDFRERTGLAYSLEAGLVDPFNPQSTVTWNVSGLAVNVFFENGFVIGCPISSGYFPPDDLGACRPGVWRYAIRRDD